jgi:hypothetical protein
MDYRVKEVDVYVQFREMISRSSSRKYNRRTNTTIQASVSEDEEECAKEIVVYERI